MAGKLGWAAAVVALLGGLLSVDAISTDAEVDQKLRQAQVRSDQSTAQILFSLQLFAARETVEGLAAQLRLEEFMVRWFATELARETDAGRVYELEHQKAQSERNIVSLYDRYNKASELLESYQNGSNLQLGQSK